MKWLRYNRESPGFRFNLMDLGLILMLSILSAYIYKVTSLASIAFIPLYLGISFFLFCNVFRIGNRIEPFWYIPFTASAIYGISTENFREFWIIVIYVLEPLKWFLIFFRIKRGPYVGIMSHKLKSFSDEILKNQDGNAGKEK